MVAEEGFFELDIREVTQQKICGYADTHNISIAETLDRVVEDWDSLRRKDEKVTETTLKAMRELSKGIVEISKQMRFLEHHLISQTDFE